MPILDANVQQYLIDLLPPRDAVLTEMEAYAKEKKFPIIGPQVGGLLAIITMVKQPKVVFEMGSGFGYSAYWFLKASPSCHVHLTDTDANYVKQGTDWLNRAGFAAKYTYHQSYAQDALREYHGSIDIIYNDVDKAQYPEVFSMAMDRLTSGGLLITDNALWGGDVVNPDITDADTEGIREYNRLAFNTPGVLSRIVPVRDGIVISIKE